MAAKVYLKKEAQSLKKIKNLTFKNYLLYKAVLLHTEEVIESILSDEFNKLPLKNSNECDFYRFLYYPESLMVCIDKNLCGYLEELHKLIHKTLNSFALFYSKNEYSEAFFIFKDFKEQILKLLSTISELYFVTFSDVEKSFFKLVSLIEKEEDVYITMIDFKNLKNLNNIYGEIKVSEAIGKIEKALQRFFKNDLERSLLIRGITANFYILNIKCKSVYEYIHMVEKIKHYLENELKKLDIELESIIVGLKIEKYSNYAENDVIKLLHILKDEAKKISKNVFLAVNSEEKEKLNEIFYEKYNKRFVKEKIDKKEIEIEFQPIVDIKSDEIYSLEVLGRFKEGKKLLSAGIFIEKIYEMGLIDKFDIAVIEKVIENIELIKKVSCRVFINVSFNALLNSEYLKLIEKLMERSGDLETIFELTEQKFIENIDIVENIHKKHNLFFAIDDFGSGYSSLKSVVDLVKKGILKVLKIDGSLVLNIEKDEYLQKIIKIISKMSNELNILSVGEFVENEEVKNLLKEFKIDLAQGYYISKPKNIYELIARKKGMLEF
ncbi:EAL domain-containing protein [Caminibacter sp.]